MVTTDFEKMLDMQMCRLYNDRAHLKNSPLLAERNKNKMSKMTFQPKKISHARVHGFRARMSTKGGRKVLSARRRKGRKVISA